MKRRYFIQRLGLASGALMLGCEMSNDSGTVGVDAGGHSVFKPNLFVELKPDGRLVLTASRSEMGQGVRTSLTSVIADEMDADWELVQVIQAPGDDAYGNQNTDGSRSIRTIYEPMREMGATARAMLISAAAARWKIEPDQCITEKHHVVNTLTGEKLFYGALALEAAKQARPETVKLKKREEFNYIGKGLKSVDNRDFTTGKAVYGLDVKLPGMKYACLERCPVTFGKLSSFDPSMAMEQSGVEGVIQFPRIDKPFGSLGGLAVIATNSWAALMGKKALKVEWDYGENKDYDTDAYMEEITSRVRTRGKLIDKKGNVEKAFSEAHKTVDAVYQLPHLVHTPMEVPNATADFKDGTCEIWAPVQAPQLTRQEVSDLLGIDLEKVTVHVTMLGGGFGRKSKPDFVLEAAWLSKETGSPVQVLWTREDDVQNSYYHAISSQYLKGSLNEQGDVTGWLHRTAYPSITSTFMPGVKHGAGFEFQQGMTNQALDVENLLLENAEAEAHVRIGWLRSVYNIIHGFSTNVFIDELARAAGKDALEFRLNLIGPDRVLPSENDYALDTRRYKGVLQRAAEIADWGKEMSQGKGIGLALHYSFYSYVAAVAQVSMHDGKVKADKIFIVADCGTVVNRNTVRAQLEGAVVFGLSLALYGKISAKEGRIQQANFHDYEMLRIHQCPEIQVEIIESEALPTGIGEPGVPVIAPSIVNAIFDATGKRVRKLPLKDLGLV